MKRLAIAAAVAMVFLLPGTPVCGQVTLSVWGGLNVARMVRTPAEGPPDRTGASFGHTPRRALGFSVGIPICNNWGIQLNAGNSQKGGDISDPFAKITWKHDYREFSVLMDVALALDEGDRARLHLLAGPALAYKQSCKVTAEYESGDENFDCTDANRWKQYWDDDLGLVGGAEVEIGLSGRAGFAFGALYTYGLRDLDDDQGGFYIVKNRNLTLRAGLSLSID